MQDRGYKVSDSTKIIFLRYITDYQGRLKEIDTSCNFGDVFKDWHNDRYYTQCYYNLQEKYDCGGIKKEEWDIIRTYSKLNCEEVPVHFENKATTIPLPLGGE